MDKSLMLKEILERNPAAKAQSETIEKALELARQLREFGRAPYNYGLDGPFGDRAWVRRSPVRNSKLTEDA